MRADRAAQLASARATLVMYMKQKIEAEDWHGVSDAANDLREIDRELSVLRYRGYGRRKTRQR